MREVQPAERSYQGSAPLKNAVQVADVRGTTPFRELTLSSRGAPSLRAVGSMYFECLRLLSLDKPIVNCRLSIVRRAARWPTFALFAASVDAAVENTSLAPFSGVDRSPGRT